MFNINNMVLMKCMPFISLLTFSFGKRHDWTYIDQKNWGNSYPSCDGNQQSPINIDTSQVRYGSHLVSFVMQSYDNIPPHAHWEMLNTGTGFEIDIQQGKYILRDGGLTEDYRISKMIFHWGTDERNGSEHTIDGQVSPLELQIYHYPNQYASMEEAINQNAVIVALAFQYEIYPVENPTYKHFLHEIDKIPKAGDSLAMRPLPILALLPLNLNDYYQYEGSLTTPPCAEKVLWTVFRHKIPLSLKQVGIIRNTFGKPVLAREARGLAPVVGNARQQQPLHGRVVYSSCRDHATFFTSPLSSPVSVTVALFFGIVLMMIFMKL